MSSGPAHSSYRCCPTIRTSSPWVSAPSSASRFSSCRCRLPCAALALCAAPLTVCQRPPPPNCTVPANLTATHRCIRDGEHLFVNETQLKADIVQYFVYEVPAGAAGLPTLVYHDTNLAIFTSWTKPFPILPAGVGVPGS